MTAVLIFNTILFTLLFLIWHRRDWFNMTIKCVMFGAAVSNAILLARVLGWVVQA